MCIEQVPAFRHGGKLYEKEDDAIHAALTEIATKIVKDHASAPINGLLLNRDALVRLLTRHQELSPTPTGKEVTSETGTGEPKR